MWSENFKTHADTKPLGPSSGLALHCVTILHHRAAVGIDVVFTGSQHLYGIPEHATNTLLRPTKSC